MRHVPHLHLPGPWEGDRLPVPPSSRRHLSGVLRLSAGADVTYTDGAGIVGRGTWSGTSVERGEESETVPPLRRVRLAVAPPRAKDRQRSIVEKLQELGVAELIWITTERSQVPAPRPERSRAWAIAALEQSRRSRLMGIASARLADVSGHGGPILVADPGASHPLEPTGDDVTVVVGPEGGLTDDEAAIGEAVGLGTGTLRTDTAAVVAAALLTVTAR